MKVLERKQQILSSALLGVCKAVVFSDAACPGETLGPVSSLSHLSPGLFSGLLPPGAAPAVLIQSVIAQHCCLSRLSSPKLGMQKSLCISPGVAEDIWQKPEASCWAFCMRGFSQMNSLLEDHVVSTLIKDKVGN